MQEAFAYVLFGAVAVGVVCAAVALMMSGKAYDDIGKGLFFKDSEAPRPAAPAISDAERDDEIRQMLTARNTRRAAAGRETVDVEEELARLVRPAADVDPALREEIRELVIAKNARRVRKGLEPLDVETEVERQIRDLS